jgi:hypothetical protein
MNDDWLEQLNQLHEADKAKQQIKTEAQTKQEQAEQARRKQAIDLLRQSQAHELLRQVQKTLLGGGGILDIFNQSGGYERVITLSWQGPISAARRTNPADSEEYSYIMVGVRQERLWVNGKPVADNTPEALKMALLEACKNPGREKPGNKAKENSQ